MQTAQHILPFGVGNQIADFTVRSDSEVTTGPVNSEIFMARLKQQRILQAVKRVKAVVADFKALTVQPLQKLTTTQSQVRPRTVCGPQVQHTTATAVHLSFIYYDIRSFYAVEF
jgi:hypothetical protein